jgi:hypothetical protein
MLMMTPDGVKATCLVCRQPLTPDSVGLYRPLTGREDVTDLLLVHQACRQAEVIALLLPRYSSRRWAAVLEDLSTPAEEPQA